MKKRFDDIIRILIAVLSLLCIVAASVGVISQRKGSLCRGIRVTVKDSLENKFFTQKDVRRLIAKDFGGCINRPVDSISCGRLEKMLLEKGLVGSCAAYFTSDCFLNVELTQSTPLLRLKTPQGVCYVDRRGGCFKVEQDWKEGLPTAEGSAADFSAEHLARCAALAEYMCRTFPGMVDHFVLSPSGQVSMFLEGCGEEFILGAPTQIRRKAEAAKTYMEKIRPLAAKDSKEYTSVNLKYKGQAVCR